MSDIIEKMLNGLLLALTWALKLLILFAIYMTYATL
jgi:hypothetical protein